jgi:hypothetical protein
MRIYEISILNELKPMESSLKTFSTKLHVIYQWAENLKLLAKKLINSKCKNLKPL